MNIDAGRQVPRCNQSMNLATRGRGYRGMDTMHPPRAIQSRVNALGGTPENSHVLRNPRRLYAGGTGSRFNPLHSRNTLGVLNMGILGSLSKIVQV